MTTTAPAPAASTSEVTPLLLEQRTSSSRTEGGDSHHQDRHRRRGWKVKLNGVLRSRPYRAFTAALIIANLVVLLALSVLLVVDKAPQDDDDDSDDGKQHGKQGQGQDRVHQLLLSWGWYWQVGVVLTFAVDSVLHCVVADLASSTFYHGMGGHLRYLVSFWSLIDLVSILPFVVWTWFGAPTTAAFAFAVSAVPLPLQTTTWIRVVRLLLLGQQQSQLLQPQSERRRTTQEQQPQQQQQEQQQQQQQQDGGATSVLFEVFRAQLPILGTAGFVGLTTWMTVSALYYLAERRNPEMIYCPGCSDDDDSDSATDNCAIDFWGLVVNCTGCSSSDVDGDDTGNDCYNLYESIPMASYYALLNLFGEFPLVTQHSVGGMVVGTLTAVVAVAVFALPVGIIGNGFADVLDERAQQHQAQQARQQAQQPRDEEEEEDDDGPVISPDFYATDSTFRGRVYNFWFTNTTRASRWVNHGIHLLVLITSLSYMVETTEAWTTAPVWFRGTLNGIEATSVVLFTVEYCLKMYSVVENPKFDGDGHPWRGRWNYAWEFLPIVDLLSFLPFWLQCVWTGDLSSFYADNAGDSVVATFRLLRILRFEKYTRAFTTFDDVFRMHFDVLAVTAGVAMMLWVLLGFGLYYSEASNPDPEMAENYKHIPNSMWITLLNLAGESPLCQYSAVGKVITGLLGLFATGLFGIPIGVLGAGFEEIVTEENADNTEELAATFTDPVLTEADRADVVAAGIATTTAATGGLGSPVERAAYCFVNGIGSTTALVFEATIYLLIFLVVGVGIWQTVDGHEQDFQNAEMVAVMVFTVEYLIRLVGAGADPEFAKPGRSPIVCRLRFVFSFYSIVDLLAIVPYYLALALPNSIVDQYDEYLRMFRILRLLKLDKYVPSITLLDDVIRLKFNSLRVAMYAAVTLWILFAALLFLCEHNDSSNDIDPVPDYGCDDNCTMLDRFQNYFDSLIYTGIHLTGDYPITTYTWPARFVNFFMVISAVGVVSIPSGLIASGFVEIVQSKAHAKQGEPPKGRAGDDWYEHRYRALEGVSPTPSKCGPTMDYWQLAVNEFLNGTPTEHGHHEYTPFAFAGRVFIFAVIISNVVAVLLESIPRIDKAVGNDPGNFFDVFEMFSVMVFALEYILRLFCAPKNREALYSSFIYATTFFGIVDLLSTAPWFVQQALITAGLLDEDGDNAKIFRIFRIFRILQLEDFVVAFSKLDNVFRASKDVLKATGLMAMIIWVGCGALFFIFEHDNPNWRSCDSSVPLRSDNLNEAPPGCFDFRTTKECNAFYGPGTCEQSAFTNMPNALYFTAVFLGGEWGVVDFTWPGRIVCLFLCVVGIALYAIPVGTLFDSFGAVLGLVEDDGEDEEGCDDGSDKEPATGANAKEKAVL